MQLPARVPLVAYRTAQEALTNISKHAQATRVGIDLSLAGGVLSLEVSDNGRGLAQRRPGQGAQLRPARAARARQRRSAAGSTCRAAAGGTTLILSVPLRRSRRIEALAPGCRATTSTTRRPRSVELGELL